MLDAMLFWGLTLGILGKAFLAISVIFVHKKITEEKRIDGLVLMEMKRERSLALIGLGLMIAGYILELLYYDFVSF